MSNLARNTNQPSSLVNSSSTKRKSNPKKDQKVDLQAVGIPSDTEVVGANDLVSDAIVVADAELKLAVTAYDDRRAENVTRFFQHIRTSQERTSKDVRQMLHTAYGLTEADIYDGGEANESETDPED